MASQTVAFIQNAKSKGMKDSQIWNELRKDAGFNNGIKQARADGFSQEQIAGDLGLRVKFIDSPKPKPKPTPQPTPKPEKPSLLVDIGAGMDDIFSGIKQGALWAGDRAAKQSNINLGTNFDTNDYGKFTKAKAEEKAFYEKTRKESGAGMNVGRFIGQTVATLPVSAAAKGFGTAKVLSGAGAKVLAQNALVGGAIGGAGFAENAGQRGLNVAAGAAGGAVGAVAGDKVGKGIAKVAQKVVPSAKSAATARVSATIDDQIEIALKQSNIKISDLSDDIVKGLKKDVAAALKSGKAVDSEAIARKVVLDRVGIRPTKAQLTGNPKLWQKEAELAKLQDVGEPLRDKFVKDNIQLRTLVDDEIAKVGGKADDGFAAAQNATDSLLKQNKQNKSFVNAAYDNAYKSSGNDVVLDGRGFANDAITNLDQQYAMSSLPPSVSKIIKDVEKTPDAFTLGKSEELIKILNREYKASLVNGQKSSSTYAIGIVRDALEGRQSEAMQGLLTTGGNDAAQAYQLARNAYKTNAKLVKSIPMLDDALTQLSKKDGRINYDDYFNRYILKGKVEELKTTVDVLKNANPQAVADIKGQVLEHIASKSFNQNGQPSPSGMNKTIQAFGDRRLNALFSPEEIARLKDIGKAMHYLTVEPPHAAVNRSNTGAALANFVMGVTNLPFVGKVASLLKGPVNAVQVNNALKPSITTGSKLSPEAINQMMLGDVDRKMIDQLTKLGVIGGANTTSR